MSNNVHATTRPRFLIVKSKEGCNRKNWQTSDSLNIGRLREVLIFLSSKSSKTVTQFSVLEIIEYRYRQGSRFELRLSKADLKLFSRSTALKMHNWSFFFLSTVHCKGLNAKIPDIDCCSRLP